MNEAWRERILYYGFAAALGALLLLNFLGVFNPDFQCELSLRTFGCSTASVSMRVWTR
jgi:hypothetical protein